jgi:hypothetical protein
MRMWDGGWNAHETCETWSKRLVAQDIMTRNEGRRC